MPHSALRRQLEALSRDLVAGRVGDDRVSELQRLLKHVDDIGPDELRAIRRIATLNCDLALAARKGILAAGRVTGDGGSPARTGVYGQSGARERLGRAPATISINI